MAAGPVQVCVCAASGVFDLLQVEDGSKGKSLARAGGEGDQFHLRFARGARNRAVGGAEVDTDCRDLVLRVPHSLHYSSSTLNH